MRIRFISSFKKNSNLIEIFTKREIQERYKGSNLGGLWSVINPLIMLCVYTLVFSKIFNSRWGAINEYDSDQGALVFAINLFAGLIVFNMFAECTIKSPILIHQNANFVKKVIFPLEVLGIKIASSAVFHGCISAGILIIVSVIEKGTLSTSMVLLPLLWGGYYMILLGVTWVLSTIGVLIKDIAQITGSFVNIMMFMSPVFYPTEAVPEGIRWISKLNPIGYVIERTREIVFENKSPGAIELIIYIVLSCLWCEFSFRLLKANQSKFGDAI